MNRQQAVGILLTLLNLGIKDILLGPSLPAFVSPNVMSFLVENYNIAPISDPETDMKKTFEIEDVMPWKLLKNQYLMV